MSYITPAMASEYRNALYGVWETFARPLSVYLDAKVLVVNTTPSFAGMFGDASQDATGPSTTLVTPQVYIISGCINYANGQPWEYVSSDTRAGSQQNKVRESDGKVKIKVNATGYALLNQAQQVLLDGYTFSLNSTPRPHGIVGQPDRWTFELLRTDPS